MASNKEEEQGSRVEEGDLTKVEDQIKHDDQTLDYPAPATLAIVLIGLFGSMFLVALDMV